MKYKTFAELGTGQDLFFIDPKSPNVLMRSSIREVLIDNPQTNVVTIYMFRAMGKALNTFATVDEIPTIKLIFPSKATSIIASIEGAPVPFFTSKEELLSWLKMSRKASKLKN